MTSPFITNDKTIALIIALIRLFNRYYDCINEVDPGGNTDSSKIEQRAVEGNKRNHQVEDIIKRSDRIAGKMRVSFRVETNTTEG